MKVYLFAALAIVLAGSAIFLLSDKFLKKNDSLENQAIVPSKTISGPQVGIRSETSFAGPVVSYQDGQFFPKNLNLSMSEGIDGCLIKIQNDSSETFLPRLSPYSPEDKIGFRYSPIEPGKSGIIDPRYGEIKEVAFHNRNNPKAEFLVSIDKSCF